MAVQYQIYVYSWHGSANDVRALKVDFPSIDTDALIGPDQSPKVIATTANPLVAESLRLALEKCGAEAAMVEQAVKDEPWWRQTAMKTGDFGSVSTSSVSASNAVTDALGGASGFVQERAKAIAIITGVFVAGLVVAFVIMFIGSAIQSTPGDSVSTEQAIGSTEPAPATYAGRVDETGRVNTHGQSAVQGWPTEPPDTTALQADTQRSFMTRYILLVLITLLLTALTWRLARRTPVLQQVLVWAVSLGVPAYAGFDLLSTQAELTQAQQAYAATFAAIQSDRYAALVEALQESSASERRDAQPNERNDGANANGQANNALGPTPSNTPEPTVGQGGREDETENAPTGTDEDNSDNTRDGSGDRAAGMPQPEQATIEDDGSGSAQGDDIESEVADEDESPAQNPDTTTAATTSSGSSAAEFVAALASPPAAPCDDAASEFARLRCLLDEAESRRPPPEVGEAIEQARLRAGAGLASGRRLSQQAHEAGVAAHRQGLVDGITERLAEPEVPGTQPPPVTRYLWAGAVLVANLLLLIAGQIVASRRAGGGKNA